MTLQSEKRRGHRRRAALRWAALGIAVLGLGALSWMIVDTRETNRLGRDTRVVVRFPETVIDQLTADEIHETFPIDEETETFHVTGTANAVGKVSIRIEPHAEPDSHDDALILIEVNGTTDNDLVSVQSPVRVLGDGTGTFRARTRVHFDGFKFVPEEAIEVEATHETEIADVEPLPGTPLGGAVRLIASRKARTALPEFNKIAAGKIEDKVRLRVRELVGEATSELNRLNRLDETFARLHPDSDRWQIAVTTRDGYVQAALVPHGGRSPDLPGGTPSSLEVWMRLTRSQGTLATLMSRWKQSHKLFRQFVPDEHARRLAEDAQIARIEGWTLLRIGSRIFERETASVEG
ncbi:hypothetical protein Mal4_19970 [Maioricimonas rarisocia]|uniref:Uncharacterized protein n=1 Tax=Maioricimonas rarisocia TaxID=2528026 RepID=A0A517Z5F6_9PLAN|nr:hypothetical protein [Maioricimonas rarisocia]QDU37681.1 hypothetical protein Mal4_19970 [Maioricimonas rarisocia]